jgi:hypothetical protein
MNQHLSFEEAYPELDDVLIQSKKDPDLDPGAEYGLPSSLKARWPYQGANIKCDETDCQSAHGNGRGAFDLGESIQKALKGQEEHFIRCNGFRGSPRTSGTSPKCNNAKYFKIQVKRRTS